MAELDPIFLDSLTYPAKELRKILGDIYTEGNLTSTALAVTQSGTPAMSVSVALGRAIVTNDEGNFGKYLIENDAAVTKTIAASDPSNPRIDMVTAQVYDATDISGAVNAWALIVITGTPAASPAAPSLPLNALSLATITVAAGVTTIVNANITDARTIVTLTSKTLVTPIINTSISGTAIATGAEVTTGTDNTKIVTPKAIGDADAWADCAPPTFTVSTYDNGSGGQPTSTYCRIKRSKNLCFVQYIGTGVKAGTGLYITFNPSTFPAFAGTPTNVCIGYGAFYVTSWLPLTGTYSTGILLTLTSSANINDNTALTLSFTLCYEI